MLNTLLDSNQIILHVNGEHQLKFEVRSVAISTLTVFECFRLPGLSSQEENELREIISLCKIISVTDEIAIRAASIARTRKSLRPIDLLIAATALELDVPLVTKNVKDFRKIPGLKIQTSP